MGERGGWVKRVWEIRGGWSDRIVEILRKEEGREGEAQGHVDSLKSYLLSWNSHSLFCASAYACPCVRFPWTHSMRCVSVLDWNGTRAWWNQGKLICKADRAVLWCSVHREGKRAAQHDSMHLSAKIRTNEIQYTWLEGKERSVTDRRHEWKQPVAALLHGYQCMSQPNWFVLSPGPLLIPDKGSSVRHRDSVCEVPWG